MDGRVGRLIDRRGRLRKCGGTAALAACPFDRSSGALSDVGRRTPR
jgi:hypothetical protein